MKKTVVDASIWQEMEGSSPIVQQINSLLTVNFIFGHHMPADECLGEAEDIAHLWRSLQDSPQDPFWEGIENYLREGFCTSVPGNKVLPLEKAIPDTVERLKEILSGG